MKSIFGRRNSGVAWVLIAVLGALTVCGSAFAEDYGGGHGTAEEPYLIFDANQMNTIRVSQAGAFSSGGSGTGEDPYVITTVEQLQEMANELDAHYVLANDIDASDTIHWNGGQGFKPIGDSIVPSDTGGDDHLFSGSFDGRHYRITGLFVNRPSMDFAGLFGIVEYAEIKNVILVDIYIRGKQWVGGLVGNMAYSTVSNCSANGSINGPYIAGGLVGRSFVGSISSSASTGSVNCPGGSGRFFGGLAGVNSGHSRYGKAYVTNCYSTSNVSSRHIQVGGLIGSNVTAVVTNCYSTGLVTCLDSDCSKIGGLIGEHRNSSCSSSYWNIETSVQAQSAAGQGRTTAEMMRRETFLGWDFEMPVWVICEEVDYPRLWWEPVELIETPVLHSEPEITLGTSNTISWDAVPEANEYYAECAEDANFASIFDSSGWIIDTSFEFTGLELGQTYWYSVKSRKALCVESDWSNLVWSMQGTLGDAVDVMLDPNSLKNENMKNAFLNKLSAAQAMIDDGRYQAALNKLENDILAMTDGCADANEPDKNDWIKDCEEQRQIYPFIMETIEYVSSLVE